jgi:MFS family permease
VYSRVLHNWRDCDVILLGCWLIIPSIGLAGATITLLQWPLAVLFVASTLVGVSVGLVTTAGLTLLQASSDASEMGRVSAAYQFVRQLAIMYGLALAGAMLLLVIDVEVGDVDAVQEVIAGKTVGLAAETRNAIRHGMAWVHVVAGTIAMGCLLVGTALVRRTGALSGAESEGEPQGNIVV